MKRQIIAWATLSCRGFQRPRSGQFNRIQACRSAESCSRMDREPERVDGSALLPAPGGA